MEKDVICEIEFINPETQSNGYVIGKINTKQLFSPENAWVIVNTHIQSKHNIESSEILIAKADITTIRFYEPYSFIHFSSSHLSSTIADIITHLFFVAC